MLSVVSRLAIITCTTGAAVIAQSPFSAGVSNPKSGTPPPPSELATYQIDDGTAENQIGLTNGGDIAFVQAFVTNPATPQLLSIECSWGSPISGQATGLVGGEPFRVHIWSDDDGDSDPTNGGFTLLASASGTVDLAAIETDVLQSVAIPPTTILTARFFVGVDIDHAPGMFPGSRDTDTPSAGRAWITGDGVVGGWNPATMGIGDPNNIGLFDLAAIGFDSVYLIRATDDTSSSATWTISGQGCPRENLIYQQFPLSGSGSFDLVGQALTFRPNGQGSYAMYPLGVFNPAYSNDLNSGDDQAFTNLPLGFTLDFPGGSTNAIAVSSNGYVSLDPTYSSSRCCSGSVSLFRSGPPSFAVMGEDLNPSAAGAVYYDTFPDMAMVTYVAVPFWSNDGDVTCQIQFCANGDVVMCWTYFDDGGNSGTALVGWSGGGGVADTGPVDLSFGNYNPGIPGQPLRMDSAGLPVIGQPFQIDLTDVPPTSTSAVLMLGFLPRNVDLTFLGMSACSLLTSSNTVFPATLTGPTGSATLNVPLNTTLLGWSLEAQAVVLAPGTNTFGVITSNRGTMTFGN